MLNAGVILGPVPPSIETLVYRHVVPLARYHSSTLSRSDNSALILDAAKSSFWSAFSHI